MKTNVKNGFEITTDPYGKFFLTKSAAQKYIRKINKKISCIIENKQYLCAQMIAIIK